MLVFPELGGGRLPFVSVKPKVLLITLTAFMACLSNTVGIGEATAERWRAIHAWPQSVLL